MTAEQLRMSIINEAFTGDWESVSLGEVCVHENGDRGKNYPSKDKLGHEGIPFISALNLANNTIIDDDKLLKASEVQFNNLRSGHLKKGDFVVCIRGSIGKHGIYPFEKGAIASSLVILRPDENKLSLMWLSYYFDSGLFQDSLSESQNGTAQPNLGAKELMKFELPLPPLEEQKRIVAKLEELLPIVEQYGKAQKELDELNAALPARLRQSILQEAIHGKLVPQDEKEGTAEELLKLIDAEKQRLVKERILKKAIRTSAIIPEDSPFEIPTSWLWANLEDVTYAVGGHENQILSKEILKEGKIRVVSQGQAIYDGYCNDATKEINDLPVILFGDHTRNVKYIDFPFVIGADGTKLFRPIGIYPRYLYYWMKYAASTLRNRGYARHYTLLKVVPVPLPPLAEQERIVAKIEELFAEIDKLVK